MTFKIAALALAGVSALTSQSASAAVNISIQQAGANIVVTTTGTFDRNLSVFVSTGGPTTGIYPILGYFNAANDKVIMDRYQLTGPESFGNGNNFFRNFSTSGTFVGIHADRGSFMIDSSYLDNSEINSIATLANYDFDTVGLATGIYQYQVGRNALTLIIGQTVAAVPEPTTWAMMLVGFGLIGATARYRRRHSSVRYA